MSRLVTIALALLALPLAAPAAASDRYGPDRNALRGSTPVPSSGARLTWASRQARERASTPPMALKSTPDANTQQPVEPSPAPSVVASRQQRLAPRRQADIAQPYAPEGQALRPKRYSVGREFGVEPDVIAIPDPSVLAYAPDVATAVLAQQERDRNVADPGPASPADLDLMEQRQQDAARQAQREKTQADNRRKAAR